MWERGGLFREVNSLCGRRWSGLLEGMKLAVSGRSLVLHFVGRGVCVCVCVIFPSPCLPDSFSSDMNNEVFGREPLGVDPAGPPSSPHLATSPRCYCTHPESLFLSGEWKGGRTWLRVTPVPVSVKPIVITSWCLSTPPHPPLSLLYRPRVFSSLLLSLSCAKPVVRCGWAF